MQRITSNAAALIVALVLNGCAAAQKDESAANEAAASVYTGWYLEHAGRSQFQPCGQAETWQISQTADLPARAKSFELMEDTPVYVRLRGVVSGKSLAVREVEQFGSPTPVRNCPMNGVVIPAPEH